MVLLSTLPRGYVDGDYLGVRAVVQLKTNVILSDYSENVWKITGLESASNMVSWKVSD